MAVNAIGTQLRNPINYIDIIGTDPMAVGCMDGRRRKKWEEREESASKRQIQPGRGEWAG